MAFVLPAATRLASPKRPRNLSPAQGQSTRVVTRYPRIRRGGARHWRSRVGRVRRSRRYGAYSLKATRWEMTVTGELQLARCAGAKGGSTAEPRHAENRLVDGAWPKATVHDSGERVPEDGLAGPASVRTDSCQAANKSGRTDVCPFRTVTLARAHLKARTALARGPLSR